MAKRLRRVTAKPGELCCAWGKLSRWDSPDLCYSWGGSGADKPDAHLLHVVFTQPRFGFKGYDDRTPSFMDELKARGYDITTFKFSIQRLPVKV